MSATLTELHRANRKVVRPAISGKEKVILTEFGQPCAEIRPLAEKRIVSEDDLRASQVSDEAILAAISEVREFTVNMKDFSRMTTLPLAIPSEHPPAEPDL